MDDWLKYNASEYTVNGKTYRNLEAQVLKNKEDIEALDLSGIPDHIAELQGDVDSLEANKQDKLTAGSNISISAQNVISATDTTYSAGTGISISAQNEIISMVHGVPAGGTAGQVLAKVNGDDYNTEWVNQSGGGSDKIDVIYMFSSGLVAHRSGMTANASLPNGITAENLYNAYNAGKAVALIDYAGIVAFVIGASESNGVYTAQVRGYGSYNNMSFPVIPYQFYGIVNSTSQTFTVTHFFDIQPRRETETVILYPYEWLPAGGNTFYYQNVACTGMTTHATVFVSPVPSNAYDYADYGIVCTGQYADSIEFRTKGTDTPSGNISVNVVWLT